MRVVEEREQQRDRDTLQSGGADRRGEPVDLVLGERRDDLSRRADPLGDLEPPAARHQHVGRVLKQIVQIGARRAAQFEQVAKPGGRDEPGAGALFLEQRVGDDGRRVRQQRDLARVDSRVDAPRVRDRLSARQRRRG